MVTRPGRRADEGSILVLTLLLTIVLAAVVLALATLATAGLAASHVTTERTAGQTAAANGANWAIEELAKKQLDPADCGADATGVDLPSGFEPTVTLTCQAQGLSTGNHPQVRLVSTSSADAGRDRTVTALLEVPGQEYDTVILSWIVD